MATFLLTVFRDLTEGIVIGFALGAILFIDRMSKAIAVEHLAPLVAGDRPDRRNGGRAAYTPEEASDPDTVVYRIAGAFFFGAASTVGSLLDRIADQRRNFIVDFSAVPFLDSTAANVIAGAAQKAARAGVRVYITGAARPIRRMLLSHGVRAPLARYAPTVEVARERLTRATRAAGEAESAQDRQCPNLDDRS